MIKEFANNPYDLELFLEAISIAEQENRQLEFLDRFLTISKKNPNLELITVLHFTLEQEEFLVGEKEHHG